ncbi:MAG: FdtA/QdtA family cupin domain-containing protein [Alphaproteobacteria bacterium]|nr:FdtA/QdtA family cupin domain-containing protein [Alphaproteobacteria bacterium]MBR4475198.1 FdtA/QdtA family cupin domain-containing protein [Alphaproteobacteria bacterium]
MNTTPKILQFDIMGDERGWLCVANGAKQIPFDIKRVYWIYGTEPGVARGKHAHHKLSQVLVCVSGSVDIYCEWGDKSETFTLSNANTGLLLNGLCWHEMRNFSPDAVLLVMASDYYDESDYVRDYNEFKRLNNDKGC